MILNYKLTRKDSSDANYIFKREATFKSPYELFLYCYAENHDELPYKRYYRLGAVVDGVCQIVFSGLPYDTVCTCFWQQEISGSTGEVNCNGPWSSYSLEAGRYFYVVSEDDFSCSGYTFDSLQAAQAFYDSCDISGLIKFPVREISEMPEEVKVLYLSDSIRKNIRIHFPNGERADIINDNIDGESFSFTESICSKSQLKYGLCEANVVKFTCVGIENIKGYEIEVFHEIDVTSLSNELIAQYASSSTDVPYPYFRWSYGKFRVDECPRQSDMRRRKVVAYSSSINFDVKVSPFERAKWATRFKENTEYTFNPPNFALSNISQNVNMDLSCVGAFSIAATSLKSKMTEGTFYPSLYNSYNLDRGEDIGVTLIINYEELSLIDYMDSDSVFAYKMGDALMADSDLRLALLVMMEPYKDRITGYESALEENIQKLIDNCHPVGYMQDYNKSGGYYTMKYAYGMKDSGLFSPRFDGYAGSDYGIRFPHCVVIEIRQMEAGSSVPSVIASTAISLFDWPDVDIDAPLGGELYIPELSKKLSRAKNKTGEYILDTDDYPDTMEAFKGLLELNACFFKAKKDGIYSMRFLNGNYGIYPADDLFPGAELYPSEPAQIINPGNYRENGIWYADAMIEPYTAIMANYTDMDGNKASAEYHEAEYVKKYTELLTQTFVNDGTSLIEVDLSNNPFTSQMRVYCTVDGLAMTEAWTNNGGDFLFDIYFDSGAAIFEWTDSRWSEATKLTIYVNVSGIATGTEFQVSLGSVTEEEIEGGQYNTLDLSGNYLISNYNFYESALLLMMEKTLEMISGISYMPVNIKATGMPWIEAGDRLVVNTKEDGAAINTIALQRNLSGIRSLRDNFKST